MTMYNSFPYAQGGVQTGMACPHCCLTLVPLLQVRHLSDRSRCGESLPARLIPIKMTVQPKRLHRPVLTRCPPRVQERLNLDVEVISGFEEARLIYLGVLQVPPSQPLPHQSLWKGRHRAYSETPPNEFCPADSESLPGSPAAWGAAGGASSGGSAAAGQETPGLPVRGGKAGAWHAGARRRCQSTTGWR